MVAPGAPQGQRQAMEQQQAALPLPDGTDQVKQAVGAAQQMTPPPAFDRPSEMPNEPLTAGMASGPGAGPEAFVPPNLDDSDRLLMAPWLPVLELLSTRPGTSQSTRNVVRIMRSQMPPGIDYMEM